MNHVVIGVVALVAVVALTLCPLAAVPVTGALLALTTICAALGGAPRNRHDG
ncbi:hypothetical protein [Curtobacterium sp. 1544]|uniref:hypothetical protein n=1 Tax=Curtobacterium sp. 1544 TaxID=3156417 RepID=UPI00339736F0